MATKYLDENGLLYFWQKIKAAFVTDVTYNSTSKKIQKTKAGSTSDVVTLATVATSGSYNDLSNKPTIPSGVEKTTTTPKMDGTAAIGSETKFAAGDHVHPSDTSRVPITRKVNGHALSADVTVTASDVGLGDVMDGANFQISGVTGISEGDEQYGTKYLFNQNFGASEYHSGGFYNDAYIDHWASQVASALNAKVSTSTTVNGHALTGNISISASDVSAIPTSAKGAASGVCPLDANSKVDAAYLPSYVDDVVEAYARSGATALSASWLSETSGGSALTPASGKIYILMADSGDYAANTQFRWATNTYVKLNDGGVTSITNAEIDTIVAS